MSNISCVCVLSHQLSNSKNNSSTNLFKQQDISFENYDNFRKYAKLSGVELKEENEALKAYQHIKNNLSKLKC